jgi:hypothetical protein
MCSKKRFPVTLSQHVDLDAVLIDHPSRRARLAAQHCKYLVETLGTARLVANRLDAMHGPRIESVTSAADRLMARDHAALEQKLLDVAHAEMEPGIAAAGNRWPW